MISLPTTVHSVVWLLLLLLGLAVLPALVRGSAWRRASDAGYQRVWQRLAAKLGLTFEPGHSFTSPRVSGRYRERHVALQLAIEPGLPGRLSTRLTVTLRQPLPCRVVVKENGLLGQVWHWVGVVGRPAGRADDASFRRRFSIRAGDPCLGEPLRVSGVMRRKLLLTHSIEAVARDDRLELYQPAVCTDAEHLLFLLDLLNDMARLLEAAALDVAAGATPASAGATLP